MPIPAPPPTLVELDHVQPNPRVPRRACANCVFWSRDARCAVHSPSLAVTGDMICSQYITGAPSRVRRRLPLVPLNPHWTGLERTRAGTACDNCSWFDAGASRCRRAAGAPAVSPLGCCDAWRQARGGVAR